MNLTISELGKTRLVPATAKYIQRVLQLAFENTSVFERHLSLSLLSIHKTQPVPVIFVQNLNKCYLYHVGIETSECTSVFCFCYTLDKSDCYLPHYVLEVCI